MGVNINDQHKSRHYKQLFDSILCIDVRFNKGLKNEDLKPIVGETCLDVVVDKDVGDSDGLIVVIQRIQKFAASDKIVGVLTFGMKTNNRWFMINDYETTTDKSKVKYLFIVLSGENH